MKQDDPRTLRKPKIMDTNQGIKSNQPNKRVLRQLLHNKQQLILKRPELLLRRTRVHHEHKRGPHYFPQRIQTGQRRGGRKRRGHGHGHGRQRHGRRRRRHAVELGIEEGVLDGTVGREKLGGEIGFSDAGVRARKRVFLVAEGAEPNARGVVEASVWVQHGAALRAEERVVREDWELCGLHQWRAHHA